MVLQNYQNLIKITSNMFHIDAFGVGFKCPRKIHLNTQCPRPLLRRSCTKIMVVLRTRFLAPKDAVRCRSKPERKKKVFPEGLETFAGSLGLAGCLAFHNGDNLVFWSQNYKCAFVPVSKHFLQTWSLLNRRAHCLDLLGSEWKQTRRNFWW